MVKFGTAVWFYPGRSDLTPCSFQCNQVAKVNGPGPDISITCRIAKTLASTFIGIPTGSHMFTWYKYVGIMDNYIVNRNTIFRIRIKTDKF